MARLKAAGAIVYGKTNVPRWSGDIQTYNDLFGVTNNPWDPTRTPGGSSGGAAAAVAGRPDQLRARHRHRRLGADPGQLLRRVRPQAQLRDRLPARLPGPRRRRADRRRHQRVRPAGPQRRRPRPAARRPGRAQRRDAAGLAPGPAPARHDDLSAYRVGSGWTIPRPRSTPRWATPWTPRHAPWPPPAPRWTDTRPNRARRGQAAVQRPDPCRRSRSAWTPRFGEPLSEWHHRTLAGLITRPGSPCGRCGPSGSPASTSPVPGHADGRLPPLTIRATSTTGSSASTGQPRNQGDTLAWTGLIGVAYLPSTVVPVGRTPDGLPVGDPGRRPLPGGPHRPVPGSPAGGRRRRVRGAAGSDVPALTQPCLG